MATASETELVAMKNAETLIKFGSENKNGISIEAVSAVGRAWDAHTSDSWNEKTRTDFWQAYDQICSFVRPVTVETLRFSQPSPFRLFGIDRWTVSLSTPGKIASAFTIYLGILLAATSFGLFIGSAGDTLVSEIDALNTRGDAIIEHIRRLKEDAPKNVSPKDNLTGINLPRDTKIWANKLNAEMQSLFATSDQLFEKSNASVFRLLRVESYEPCPENSKANNCYKKGGLTDQAQLSEIEENLRNYFDHFETRRNVTKRRDQAATRLQILKTCFLPALLGMLGACTYVVRLISEQMRDSTFSGTSGLRHLVRVILGSLVGIVVTFLWTKGTPETISSSALSFIAGYAIEPVFATFDTFADKFRRA